MIGAPIPRANPAAESQGARKVALLWTGGWDSTFQLLRLLLLECAEVTPYYLIDEDRCSTGVELRVIKRIKNRLAELWPATRELLQPMQFFSVSDVPQSPQITAAFKGILQRRFLGTQYEWLARFCESHAIERIQLCVHRDDKAHAAIENLVACADPRFPGEYELKPEFGGTDEHTVFRYFSLPLFDLTKTEMQAMAERNGWWEIMQMTWFCHRPTPKGQPCGLCNPCRYAIEEGLGWRIPLSRRLAGEMSREVVKPLKRFARTCWRHARGRA